MMMMKLIFSIIVLIGLLNYFLMTIWVVELVIYTWYEEIDLELG